MRRLLFIIIACAIVLGPAAFLFAAMEPAPLVTTARTGTAADAARARSLVAGLRALTETGSRETIFKLSQPDINSLIAFAARAVPSLRGEAVIEPQAVHIASSLRMPHGRWLNARLAVAPSNTGLDIASAALGPFDLPAELVLPIMRWALNLALGNDVGTILTTSIDGVAIDDRAVRVGIALSRADRETVTTAIARIRAEDVRRFYLALDREAKEGGLGSGGSVIAYLRAMMRLVQAHPDPQAEEGSARSALLALAIYCGHAKVEQLIGDVVPPKMRGKATHCARATLGGRTDLRQHFVVSAGLEAASNATIAFTIGEIKELLDSNHGSGFSFDDIAADRAGIRFARLLMSARRADWSRLRERLAREDDILPSVADLPAGLSQSEFERRYGDIDSDAYREILARIERRIDELAFFAGG